MGLSKVSMRLCVCLCVCDCSSWRVLESTTPANETQRISLKQLPEGLQVLLLSLSLQLHSSPRPTAPPHGAPDSVCTKKRKKESRKVRGALSDYDVYTV